MKEPPGEDRILRNGMRKALILLLAACALFLCAAGSAESMHGEITNEAFDMEVTVGYNGAVTYGKVIPVRVRIRNYGDDFEGVLGINAYVSNREYDRYEKTIALPAGAEREYEIDLTVFARQDTFTAEIVKDGEVICAAGGKPATVINPSAMLIGVLSTRSQNLNNLNIDHDNDALSRFEVWQTVPLTAETFPEDLNTLKSFGLLVIDDLDPATLSDRQRSVLDAWLRNGRILICGGGANAGRNAAFFSEYTGLSMGDVTTSDSVIASLEHLIGRKESGKQTTATLAAYSGAEPLAADAEGRGLIWRTQVGAGRIYTAAFETGDPKLNSESLMHYFWQQLLIDQDQELYSSVMYANSNSDTYSFTSASGYLPVAARSMLLPGALIVAGMLALACVLWWVLKKRDLRQWMWLALPLLALAAAVSLALLSFGAETNQPMAVIAENLIQDASGAVRNYSGVTAVAPSYGLHSYSMAGENMRVQVYDYVDYDEDEEEKRQEPDRMRTCYTVGGANTVTMECVEPRQLVNLTVEDAARMQGRMEGTVWMEEDGLHGEVLNATDLKMSAGYVITTYGYAKVPALAPGESTEFCLKKSTFANPKDPKYKENCMYTDSSGMYSVINAATGNQDDMVYSGNPEDQEKAAAAALINNAADLLRRGQGNWSYGAYESALFLYSAKPEDTEPPELIMDGKPVEKKAGTSILTAELSYLTVGRTGVICRSAGMDMPVRVETDDTGLPTEEPVQNAKNTYYHTLGEKPTFLFTFDGLEGIKVECLQVILNSYYANQAVPYALNVKTRQWEEIKINTDIKDPARYLDGDGKLYLQFRTDGQDMYADIPTPLINLEGRQEHAED